MRKPVVSFLVMVSLLSGCSDNNSSVSFNPQDPAPGPSLNRAIDGSNSNQGKGAAHTAQMRLMAAAYLDGMNAPSGSNRPNPRTISNTVIAQSTDLPDPDGRSAVLWAWGQFLDHDIALTEPGDEDFSISIPAGDPQFDPQNTGSQQIPMRRSVFDPNTGLTPDNPRRQMNSITAFVDASQVYGSDDARALALREMIGGRLRVSEGNYPPFNELELANDNPLRAPAASLYLAGDVRANENPVLLSLHTLFVREHNRQAGLLAAANPSWGDEKLYQEARRRVIALTAHITYEEFLPALLGRSPLPPYTGFRADVDPSIALVFSTAAYRLGHTLIGPTIERLQADGSPSSFGTLSLREVFFQPQALTAAGGIAPLWRGLVRTPSQMVDARVIDDLRNFLFGPPGSGGMDLASLNIQRGRDHGLPDFNSVRKQYGLAPITSFAQLTSDPEIQQRLEAAYGSPADLDPWVGFVSEDPVPGAAVGPTLRAVLVEQFSRLRDGDRFFYLNDPALEDFLPELVATQLAHIVSRNSEAELTGNLFFISGVQP